MNNKTIILSLLAMASVDAMAQRITAKNEIVDCGSVMYETPVTVKFELTNKGSELNIDQVRVSCGCTTVDYPRTAIPKGDSFTVTATYDARQLGHFEKEVALFCNSSKHPFYLKMKGVVVDELSDFTGTFEHKIDGMMVDKNDVEFDDVNRGDYPVQLIHIKNNTGETISPVVMHLPAYLTASVSPTNIAPGKTGVATLKLNSKKLRDFGLTQTSVFLAKKPGEKVSIDKPTKTETVIIENTGRSVLDIRSMQMFTTGMSVKLNKTKIKPGEQAKLKVTLNKKQLRNARSKPRVLIITNDPKQPKVVVKMKLKTR